jgi:uncharacterized membrane protein
MFAQRISASSDSATGRRDHHRDMSTKESTQNGSVRVMHLVPPKELVHPALLKHAHDRAMSFSNRLADRITDFAGSMRFVLLHVIWFTCWIAFGVESYPYGLLTMIVSLEAIFLSTFVMISQNRADEKREVIANAQWQTVQEEDSQNEELLDLSHQILDLTKAVHAATGAPDPRRT